MYNISAWAITTQVLRKLLNLFWVCLRYILRPQLITRNGHWNRSLSSSIPIYSKPLCSITQCNLIEFSCNKFRGKRTKKNISNIRKIFGNFINLMCDLHSTNFSLSFIFWYAGLLICTWDKLVSGDEEGAPHLSCTLAVTQNAGTICKNKNIVNDEIGAFFKRNWNT